MAREKISISVTYGTATVNDSYGTAIIIQEGSSADLFMRRPGSGSNPDTNKKVHVAQVKLQKNVNQKAALVINGAYRDGVTRTEPFYTYDSSNVLAITPGFPEKKANPHRIRDKNKRGKNSGGGRKKSPRTSIRRNVTGKVKAVITRGHHRIILKVI